MFLMFKNIEGLERIHEYADPATIGVLALSGVEATGNKYGIIAVEHIAIPLFPSPIQEALRTETLATYPSAHSGRSRKAQLTLSPAARLVIANASSKAELEGRKVSPGDLKRAVLMYDINQEKNGFGIMKSINLSATELFDQSYGDLELPTRTAELVGSLR